MKLSIGRHFRDIMNGITLSVVILMYTAVSRTQLQVNCRQRSHAEFCRHELRPVFMFLISLIKYHVLLRHFVSLVILTASNFE
jgi:hypothetical protein